MGPLEIVAIAFGIPLWAILIGLYVQTDRFAHSRLGRLSGLIFTNVEAGVARVLRIRR